MFASGQAHFASGDYETALAQFRRAQALRPHDVVIYNIGASLEALERYREAYEAYETVAQSAALSEAQRALARAALTRVSPQLGLIRIGGGSPGTQARIDDRPPCELPCEVRVDPGTHRVRTWHLETVQHHEVHVQRGETRRLDVVASRAADAQVVRSSQGLQDPSDAPPSAEGAESMFRPSAWFWVSGAVALAAAGAITVFGVRTELLQDEWEARYEPSVREDGELMRLLANVSIGVLGVAGIMMVIDLLIPRGSDEAVSWDARHLVLTF